MTVNNNQLLECWVFGIEPPELSSGLECYSNQLLLSLYLKLTNIQKQKKKEKTRKKIDVNLEHREHVATTQNNKKKKSIVLIKVN